MPNGFQFTSPEEVMGRLQSVPTEEDNWFMKVLTGQPLKDWNPAGTLERGIKRRRMGLEEYDLSDLLMGGTTNFKNYFGPNKELRKAFTAKFLDRVNNLWKGTYGAGIGKSADALVAKKPITAAHQVPYQTITESIPHETSRSVGHRVGRRFEVEFDPFAKGATQSDIDESMFREAAKTAQRLGHSQRDEMARVYEIAHGKEKGINPFDYSANIIAKRKMGHKLEPVKALDMYKQSMELFPLDSPTRKMLEDAMKRR